jgi:hypothetical protein
MPIHHALCELGSRESLNGPESASAFSHRQQSRRYRISTEPLRTAQPRNLLFHLGQNPTLFPFSSPASAQSTAQPRHATYGSKSTEVTLWIDSNSLP